MLNFSYHNPTRLVFGRGAEERTGEVVRESLGCAGKVLVLYGGGSARRTGLLDRVLKSLEREGFMAIEKGGVQPNPRMNFVRDTIDWIRDQGVKAIIAVGGGSVIDTAKAVAVGVEYEGDAWDFFEGKASPKQALPVFAVLSIPGAGSEQSARAVLTHHGDKVGIGSGLIRPRAAIINPQWFSSVPPNHIAAGVVDMLSHILERYFSKTTHTEFVDGQAEAAMRTILDFGPKVLADRQDYDAWSQIAMAGSFAHNGYFGLGREEDWACHGIEHEISGWNEAVVHGAGLAVVIPAWMRYVSGFAPERFLQFSRNVMNITADDADEAVIRQGIEKLVAWLEKMGLSTSLDALGIGDCPIASLARHAARGGKLGALKPLDSNDVLAILELAKSGN